MLDDLRTFARASLLLVVGALLWALNRVVEGPHEEVEAEGLAGQRGGRRRAPSNSVGSR